jgi:hypothetical protein
MDNPLLHEPSGPQVEICEFFRKPIGIRKNKKGIKDPIKYKEALVEKIPAPTEGV